ncbi:MAG: hypothetical protein IIB05_02570 [Bacteroidetes bacterium]|nr:hypothetical protein [Bacteroidota bacterium]
MKREEKEKSTVGSQQSAYRQLAVGKELKQANLKKEKRKMPLRHKNTKIHKEQTLNILYLLSSLSLHAFVAIITFMSGHNQ